MRLSELRHVAGKGDERAFVFLDDVPEFLHVIAQLSPFLLKIILDIAAVDECECIRYGKPFFQGEGELVFPRFQSFCECSVRFHFIREIKIKEWFTFRIQREFADAVTSDTVKPFAVADHDFFQIRRCDPACDMIFRRPSGKQEKQHCDTGKNFTLFHGAISLFFLYCFKYA